MWRLALIAAIFSGPVMAETVFVTRTVRSGDIINGRDLVLRAVEVPGTLRSLPEAAGMEARVALYAGQPIRIGDVGPPALVQRNSIVLLVFERGPLVITSEGRSLSRGGLGDLVRVMNLASRTSVTGQVQADGSVRVQGGHQ